MNEQTSNNRTNAKLQAIEGDFAYFSFEEDPGSDEPHIKWPISKLPKGIKKEDRVTFHLNFELGEDREAELKQKEQLETEYAEKRKLLEELVN